MITYTFPAGSRSICRAERRQKEKEVNKKAKGIDINIDIDFTKKGERWELR